MILRLLPLQPFFKGQSVLVIGYDDPVLPTKVMRDFIKAEKCEKNLQIKGAVLDGEELDPVRLSAVADLAIKAGIAFHVIVGLPGTHARFCGGFGSNCQKYCWGVSRHTRKQNAERRGRDECYRNKNVEGRFH